jgi:hypothetical protein
MQVTGLSYRLPLAVFTSTTDGPLRTSLAAGLNSILPCSYSCFLAFGID